MHHSQLKSRASKSFILKGIGQFTEGIGTGIFSTIITMVGIGLSLTVIGLPLGIPLLIGGLMGFSKTDEKIHQGIETVDRYKYRDQIDPVTASSAEIRIVKDNTKASHKLAKDTIKELEKEHKIQFPHKDLTKHDCVTNLQKGLSTYATKQHFNLKHAIDPVTFKKELLENIDTSRYKDDVFLGTPQASKVIKPTIKHYKREEEEKRKEEQEHLASPSKPKRFLDKIIRTSHHIQDVAERAYFRL